MTKPDALAAFTRADEAWGRELIRVFGRSGAYHEAYLPAGKGEPGTELRRLHDARETARIAWEHACGIAR